MLSSTQRASGAPNRGISSPSFHGSGSSRTGHLQGWKAGGECPQPLQRRAGMPCPLFNKRARISNSSVSPRAPGVLWPPATQPHACLHIAYCGLRGPLRAVFGHRGPFRTVEEVVLPRAPFSGGVDISSGRSRTMAHRPDRISIRNPKEGVQGLAFGMVLHRGRPIAGSCPDRPP